MPVRDAVARLTVLPVPTVLSAYVAVSDVSAIFAALLASPEGTFTRVSAEGVVIVDVTPRSYVFVVLTTSEPPMVTCLAVMFAVKLGCVSA